MRVLAISYMVPPLLYPQAIQIGRLLTHLDAEVAVISGDTRQGGAGSGAFISQVRPWAFHAEVPAPPPLFKGLAHRLALYGVPFYARCPDTERGWVAQAEAATAEQIAAFRPDLMVTFGEPMSDHLLGLRLKKRFQLPWVAHFSDPWADNPFRRKHWLSQPVNRWLERQVVAAADRMIVTSAETQTMIMRNYPADWNRKVRVLGHSFDPALYPARPAGPHPVSAQAPLRLRYLGNFYGHRSPAPLFRALDVLQRTRPALLEHVRIELIGGIPPRMLRSALFRSLPAGLVQPCGSISYADSLRLMTETDLLLVIDGPDKLSVFLPSKLIDYLGSGTPVLGIVPPGASQRVISAMGGQTADPTDTPAIVQALTEAIGQARQRRAQAGAPVWGDDSLRQGYHIRRVSADFAAILADTPLRG